MKRRYLVLGFALFIFAVAGPPVRAQTSATGRLVAQTTDCTVADSCVTLNISSASGGVAFTLDGTFSATAQFEALASVGGTWKALSVTPSNSSTTVTSATAGGIWQANVAGYIAVRIRVSTYNTGAVTATIQSSTASARGGSGSGGGGSSLTSTQVGFGSAGNTLTGSANFTFNSSNVQLLQVSSCGLTPVGQNVVCGPGLGTAYVSKAVVSELIKNTDTNIDQVWTNSAATGNSGSSRGSFMAMETSNNNSASLYQYINGALGAAIVWGPTGIFEAGANNTDLSATEIKANKDGDLELLANTGNTVKTTASSDAAIAFTILPHSATQSGTMFSLNNNSTATPYGSLDVVRGNGIGGFVALRETIQETGSDTAHLTWSKTAPASSYFFESFSNTGEYQFSHFNGTVGNNVIFLAGATTGVTFDQPVSVNNLNLGPGGTNAGKLTISATAPTVSSGFGTGASVTASNGTAAFRLGVGTSNTGTGVVALPTATTGWNCFATNITTKNTNQATVLQTASTTASATFQNYTDVMATHAMTDNDVLAISCFAY